MTLKNFTFVSNTTMTVTMNSKSKTKQFFLLHTGYQFQIKTKSTIKLRHTCMYQEAHSTWNWDIYTSNNISWDFSARALPLDSTLSPVHRMMRAEKNSWYIHKRQKSHRVIPKSLAVVYLKESLLSFLSKVISLCFRNIFCCVMKWNRVIEPFWNLETDKARYVFL